MQSVNFLVLGSGAREHALSQKLLESEFLNKLYLADANDGFSHLGENIEYTDFEDLALQAKDRNIDILVVGPENPLCEGVVDIFKTKGIRCIGADKKWSRLESSKHFAKKFMEKHGIKTAGYVFIEKEKNFCHCENVYSRQHESMICDEKYVIKADGLCKGKGVAVVRGYDEMRKTVEEYLNGKFGKESEKLLVEEFLDGEELSLMSLWDGKTLLSFISARDFKRKSADPLSPNTGGMGAYCPVDLNETQKIKLKAYEEKLKTALTKEKADFIGFIYSGLIWHKDDFYVLEYNMRLGDPETQAILTHLDSDLGAVFYDAVNQKLNETELIWKQNYSACLVLSASVYPEGPSCGEKISLKNLESLEDVYFAGVKKCGGDYFTNGGRILSLCANGSKPFETLKAMAQKIEFNGKYYREDL